MQCHTGSEQGDEAGVLALGAGLHLCLAPGGGNAAPGKHAHPAASGALVVYDGCLLLVLFQLQQGW